VEIIIFIVQQIELMMYSNIYLILSLTIAAFLSNSCNGASYKLLLSLLQLNNKLMKRKTHQRIEAVTSNRPSESKTDDGSRRRDDKDIKIISTANTDNNDISQKVPILFCNIGMQEMQYFC
jgi:hypothetical protein